MTKPLIANYIFCFFTFFSDKKFKIEFFSLFHKFLVSFCLAFRKGKMHVKKLTKNKCIRQANVLDKYWFKNHNKDIEYYSLAI